jgi:hypothetical protein
MSNKKEDAAPTGSSMGAGAGILELLGGLPDTGVHCAELAAETLRRALADHLAHRNAPWKKG